MSEHRRPAGRRGWGARFVHLYGWRAYALPILSVVTVAALFRSTPATVSAHTASAPTASRSTSGAPHPDQTISAADRPTGSAGVQVEGLTSGAALFDPGAAPAPVVINLGDDAVSCATNRYQQLVVVSISKQHLWACEAGKQIRSVAVTTGRTLDGDQTPLGSWRVQAKQRHRYLVGPGYRDYVQYWVPFNGDFGLHDASWQTMPFGSQNYRQQGSHGCVHLPTAAMAWLYQWATVGRTVVTVES